MTEEPRDTVDAVRDRGSAVPPADGAAVGVDVEVVVEGGVGVEEGAEAGAALSAGLLAGSVPVARRRGAREAVDVMRSRPAAPSTVEAVDVIRSRAAAPSAVEAVEVMRGRSSVGAPPDFSALTASDGNSD